MKKFLVFLCVMFMCIGVYGKATAAPMQWVSNNHWYDVIFAEDISWADADSAAQALGPGWHLATITSTEEQAFIETLVADDPNDSLEEYWLGGWQDPDTTPHDEYWHWVTGEEWDYTNWGGSEPNSVGEHYLAIDDRYNWSWNDYTGPGTGVIEGYIVENPVPEPATMLLLGSGLVGLAGFRRKKFKK